MEAIFRNRHFQIAAIAAYVLAMMYIGWELVK